MQVAFLKCSELMNEHGHTAMALALPGKDDLQRVGAFFGGDVVRALERDNRFELRGVTLYLLTEKIRLRKLEGPVLVALVEASRLDRIVDFLGVSGTVYVPPSEQERAVYLLANPESVEVSALQDLPQQDVINGA